VLFCDSGTNSETTKRILEHIATFDDISAVIGPAASNVVVDSFNAVAKGENILMMSPAATSTVISDIQDNDLLWRTAPSDAIQGAAIARYLLNEEGLERIAIINRDDIYGNGLRDTIMEHLCESFKCIDNNKFYTAVYKESSITTDQSTIVIELEEFNPSITVLIGFIEDGGAFLELASQKNVTRFILSDGLKSDELLKLDLSQDMECQLIGTQPATPSGKNYQSFESRFNGKYDAVGSYTANAYDAVYLLGYAIAATNTSRPTGPEIAAGLKRLSEGSIVNTGTSDWNKATQELAAKPSVTINYEGASGPLDFDANGEAPSDIEGWALNIDDEKTFSLGTIFTDDGIYYDIFSTNSGLGKDCGTAGTSCSSHLDCEDTQYCELSLPSPVCLDPPTGQGVSCGTESDCADYEADFCEKTVSFSCLKQGCSEELNNCAPGYICCDFTSLDMGLPELCIDKSAGGKCARGFGCEWNDDCAEDEYCDHTFEDPAQGGTPLCIGPPVGQGEACADQKDCERNAADYCENVVTSTCLMDGCDEVLNDCSPDRHCCDFTSWTDFDLPALCIESEASGGVCSRSVGCTSNDSCGEGEYCDTTFQSDPTMGMSLCLGPPFGQGDSCATHEDCRKDYPVYADFCDADGTGTCLMQGCDVVANNCSPGYVCCDLTSQDLPTLCVPEDTCTTESSTKNPPMRPKPKSAPFWGKLAKEAAHRRAEQKK
jgi:branched-chain amino acid transport system substrate-binding protein